MFSWGRPYAKDVLYHSAIAIQKENCACYNGSEAFSFRLYLSSFFAIFVYFRTFWSKKLWSREERQLEFCGLNVRFTAQNTLGFSTLPNIDWEHWNNLPILSHKDWHCTNYKCGGKNKEQWSLSIKHLQTILAIFYIQYLQAVFGRRHNWTVHCMPWWIHIYKKVSNHCMEKHDKSSVTFELSLLLL